MYPFVALSTWELRSCVAAVALQTISEGRGELREDVAWSRVHCKVKFESCERNERYSYDDLTKRFLHSIVSECVLRKPLGRGSTHVERDAAMHLRR
jgi:hypothetical protein